MEHASSAEEESAQLQPQPHQYSGVAVSPGRPCLPASPPGWIIKVGVSNSLEWIDYSGGERERGREGEGDGDAAGSLIPSRDFPDFKQLLFCTPRRRRLARRRTGQLRCAAAVMSRRARGSLAIDWGIMRRPVHQWVPPSLPPSLAPCPPGRPLSGAGQWTSTAPPPRPVAR